MMFSRKSFSHCLLLAGFVISASPALASELSSIVSEESPRIVSIDWTHTETLLALGATPVAVAQTSDYNAWVKAPEIPSHVPDVGLRTQPNFERIHELQPDKILISPMFSTLEPQLSKIAPVSTIGLYRSSDVDWSMLEKLLGKLHSFRKKNIKPSSS